MYRLKLYKVSSKLHAFLYTPRLRFRPWNYSDSIALNNRKFRTISTWESYYVVKWLHKN